MTYRRYFMMCFVGFKVGFKVVQYYIFVVLNGQVSESASFILEPCDDTAF
jgi:hypothetical protein